MIHDNLSVNEKGHLCLAGYDTVALANKYGTPLYLMDEDKIREKVRIYKNAFKDFFPEGSCPEYASKAFSCKRIYEIMAEEDINIDVVSKGEIYTAAKAGFPMERSFFHGNNKTDNDIAFAMDSGVGHFVLDCFEEIDAVARIAKEKGVIQKVFLRVSPGIDPHTHKKIATGSVESKFGIAIITGQAMEAVKLILEKDSLCLCGFHCHVGSQIFESEPFCTAAEIMLDFINSVNLETGFLAPALNLGGGFGVRYVEADPIIDYRQKIKKVADKIKEICKTLNIPMPKILMEPGRSLVADAGLTLYSVGSVKEIEGYKTYVSVDGGMTDNPRFTLYEAEYTVINANNADKEPNLIASVSGRCCESGDLIGENLKIYTPSRNDILAVLTTGAYNAPVSLC